MAAPFSLYNTFTRKVEPFVPQQEGKVGIYVCGMTVYDHIHIGHARSLTVYDTFVRYLRHRGWQVNYVRNFTDVDDKIIDRAAEQNVDPLELAESFIDAFHRDVGALGLIAPTSEPCVTGSMEAIEALIGQLIDRGHAYQAEGSVWFSVETFSDYGKLSGRRVDEMRSGETMPGKRAAADFALWKAAKPGEPSWDSPWGPGRPGWHIECSAMSRSCIGETLDIHGGGLDLVFPHHENEIAQSEAASGKSYARYWMHCGLLNLASGQKMGKSLGNVINLHEALDQFPAEALRLYYLQYHYRSPLPWDDSALVEALSKLARLYEAREVAEAMKGSEDAQRVIADLGTDAEQAHELGRSFAERFHADLDSDFNTAQAMGHLFELARAVNRFGNHKRARKRGAPVVAPALAAFELAAAALGLMAMSSADFQAEVKAKRLAAMELSAEQIERLLAERAEARAGKDYQRADEIRGELDEMGIVVMDRPGGVEWRVRL